MNECSNCKHWKALPAARPEDKPDGLGTCSWPEKFFTKQLIDLEAKSVIGVIHLFSFPYGSCKAWEERVCQ